MNKHPLEQVLGITFKDKALLEEALTHSSYANENHTKSNERLEYVGDAVVDLCVGTYLFEHESSNEGILTKKRAQLVCEAALAHYAEKIKLGDYLYLGRGEEKAKARERESVLADAYEALLGAIYLDQGFETVKRIVNEFVVPYFDYSNEEVIDYKSRLQELLQSDKRQLKYEITKEYGEPHDRTFEVDVIMDDDIILGHGVGKSHQKAEQAAAKVALSKLAR